jgi:WD40 repeat protein
MTADPAEAPAPAPPSGPSPPANPYIGPQSFRRGKPLYGRDREAKRLLDTLIAERIVLLHSPSGAGKTSLIQANLIDRLEKEQFQILPIVRVNEPPPAEATDRAAGDNLRANRYVYSVLRSLEKPFAPASLPADELVRRATLPDRPGESPPAGAAPAEAERPRPRGLAAYLARWWKPAGGPTDRTAQVLIFDQFEEVLTVAPADRRAKRAFFADLGEALADRWLWALFAIREEYLAALAPYVRWVPTALNTTFRLDLLTPAASMQAIQNPARDARVRVHDAAARSLVRMLSDGAAADGFPAAPEDGGYVEPVHLQVVCSRVWDEVAGKAAKDGKDLTEITEQDVAACGDVAESLRLYYRAKVKAVAEDRDVRTPERAIRDWFDQKLITPQGHRGQAVVEKGDGLTQAAVDALVAAHLVRPEVRPDRSWYEMAHDRLIAPVRADNEEWRRKHLVPLQQRAALWAADPARPESLCLKGSELEAAEAWATANPGLLNSNDAQFLDACRKRRANADALRWSRNQNWFVGAAVGSLLALCVVVGLWLKAELATREAKKSAEDAGRSATRAEKAVDREKSSTVYAKGQATLALTREKLLRSSMRYSGLSRALEGGTLSTSDPVLGAAIARDAIGTINDDRRALMKLVPDRTDPDLQTTLRLAGASERSLVLNLNHCLHNHRQVGQIDGFGGDVNATAFSATGVLAAVGGAPKADGGPGDGATVGVVRRVDRDGKMVGRGNAIVLVPKSTPGPAADLLSVAITPTGQWLATGEGDEKDPRIVVWEVGPEALGTPGGLRVHAVLPSALDGAPGHTGGVTALAFSPDGKVLASGGDDGRVILWSTATWKPLDVPPLLGLGDKVAALAFHPEGSELAAGGKAGGVFLWKWNKDGAPAVDPAGVPALSDFLPQYGLARVDGIACLAYARQRTEERTPDFKAERPYVLLSGGGSELRGSVFRWEFSPAPPVGLFSRLLRTAAPTSGRASAFPLNLPHTGQVRGLAFSADGWLLATAARDQQVRVWARVAASWTSAIPLYTCAGHRNIVTCVAFHPEAEGRDVLVSGSDDQTVRVWSLKPDPDLPAITMPAPAPASEAFSPDLRCFATADQDRSGAPTGGTPRPVRVWDLATGRELAVDGAPAGGAGPAPPVADLVFSGDGRHLFAVDDGGTIRRWTRRDDRLVETIPGGSAGRVPAVDPKQSRPMRSNWLDANRDGSVVATIGFDQSVDVVAFGPAGPTRRCVVRARETDSGEPVMQYAVALSPDGAYLATAGADRLVRVFDVSGREPLEVCGGKFRHDGRVNYVAFCRGDGPPRVASASADKTVRVWDVDDPDAPPVELRGHTLDVTRVAFGPSGRHLATLGTDNTLRVWDVAPEAIKTDARGVRIGQLLYSVTPPSQSLGNVEVGAGLRVGVTTRRYLGSGSIRQVLTYELDETEVLRLAGNRFYPADTEERRKKYLRDLDPTLLLSPGR